MPSAGHSMRRASPARSARSASPVMARKVSSSNRKPAMCIDIHRVNRVRLRSRSQAGISLVELIMFIVIVSLGVVGILTVFNLTAQKSADPQVRKQMLAIAEALLEEVEFK